MILQSIIKGVCKPKRAEDEPAPYSSPITKPIVSTLEVQIEAAFRSVQLALRAALLERIAQNSPTFFVQLIVDLLVATGYGG
ncbi:hypothetical protein [Mesorhizobium sp.]|uniref:hypothetical protein n=1 Tax=Mesorhizobium sp. TaxID=1871066 RepID=UPI0025C6087D|nr:hypothetical protein [Mesorhizobium sp.]